MNVVPSTADELDGTRLPHALQKDFKEVKLTQHDTQYDDDDDPIHTDSRARATEPYGIQQSVPTSQFTHPATSSTANATNVPTSSTHPLPNPSTTLSDPTKTLQYDISDSPAKKWLRTHEEQDYDSSNTTYAPTGTTMQRTQSQSTTSAYYDKPYQKPGKMKSASTLSHPSEVRRKPPRRLCSYCQEILPSDYVEEWCFRCLQWYNSEQDQNFRLTTTQLQKALYDLRQEKDSALQTQHERFQAAALRYTTMTRHELDEERTTMNMKYDRLRLEYDCRI